MIFQMATNVIVLLGLELLCALIHIVLHKQLVLGFEISVASVDQTISIDQTDFSWQPGVNISKGCTAPLLLPNKPFVVVWNVPSVSCGLHHHEINFNNSGITVNTNGSWYGEEIVLFYTLGKFPVITANGTMINGGLPQLGDLTAHLSKVTADVSKIIPDVRFKGVGIIDWEAWRPIWDTDWGSMNIYRVKSMELVRQQHPTWNNTQILMEATKQFETASKAFLLGTLDKVRQLRTSGYFGYYKYPRCWGPSKSIDTICNQHYTLLWNEKLSWIFKASNALFPRNYFTAADVNYLTAHNYIRSTLNETLRVQAKYSGLDTPILPYVNVLQNGLPFLNKTDLGLAIREPADMGASGVVLWGSSSIFHHAGECDLISQYIQNVLGPYIIQTQQFFEQCSRDNCNNHGRCVRKDYEQITQSNLVQNKRSTCRRNINDSTVEDDNEFAAAYVCRCFYGWKGPNCSSSY